MDNPAADRGRGRGGRGSRGSRGSSRSRGRGFWRPFAGRNPDEPPAERPVGFAVLRDEASGSTSNLQSMMIRGEPCEYSGWKFYLPQEGYREGSSIVGKVQAVESYYRRNKGRFELERIKEARCFELDVAAMQTDKPFMAAWESFRQDLTEQAEETLSVCGLAMHQTIVKLADGFPSDPQTHMVHPRITGFGPVVHLRNMKIDNFGKLVAVRGTIIRVGESKYVCNWMAFRCSLCHAQQAIRQNGGICVVPVSCRDGCKARSNFVAMRSSPYTQIHATQSARLQELLGLRTEYGTVPRSIDFELSYELVDSVCPGDDVTITGILRGRPQGDHPGKDKASSSMYKTYIQAVAIRSDKNNYVGWNRAAEFTDLEMEAIRMIQGEPSTFRLLVQSLCPKICGHEMVKAGLLLGLFGGSEMTGGRRSEIHVLVVGDPGIGKSQILQSCARVAPRGIFVCGNGTTNAGLSVSVRTEAGTENSIEAGALVLADKGVCCMDEFDKMTCSNQILLEVMEQQIISVSKAGVVCTIPARTCILAAANPSGGHYDKSKTVSENLKINPALLSRFDLVFVQLDRSDKHVDALMEHVTKLHERKCGQPSTSTAAFQAVLSNMTLNNSPESEAPLHLRLKLKAGENMDLLPVELMQKYMAYARAKINPELTKPAADEIFHFYSELRAAQSTMDCIPVTTRQIEALIRLTQARARIDLAPEATLAHAQDVIAILRYSMIDVFSNDAGELQPGRLMNGVGTSQASRVKQFIQLLQHKATVEGKSVYSRDELKRLAGAGVDFERLLDVLNVQAYLLNTGSNFYKFRPA